MATKITGYKNANRPEDLAQPNPVGTIYFKMPGLSQDLTGDENDRFRLEGVPQLVLDPESVFQMLLDAGISNDDAVRYTDEFLAKVSHEQLAKHIASRIKF